MQKGRMNIVIGCQAGSEAKGKLSAFLADHTTVPLDFLYMTASPNAGHTVVIDGCKFVTYHLPVASVVTTCPIVLGPASPKNNRTLYAGVLAVMKANLEQR